VKLVDVINQELADDYFSKHPLQKMISKTTNLTHFRMKETLCYLSRNNLRPSVEGLLWALCRGNDKQILGKLYKRFVFK